MDEYKVETAYKILRNTDKETIIGETDTYTFADLVTKRAREIIIKKDRTILLTWLNALEDERLLEISNLCNNIMKERKRMDV